MKLLQTALRAGMVAWMSTTLLLVIAITPILAAQTEFPGHEHPPGTPDHVHQLQDVGAEQAFSTVLVVIIVALMVLGMQQMSALIPLRNRRAWRGVTSRAPPAAA